MVAGDLAFAALAINPIGGLMVAIPFAVFELHRPAWVALATGVPLAYVQVMAVDLGWSGLVQIKWWGAFVDRRRSPRVERLISSRSFWPTVALTPFVGPWLVMAFMRYAQIPQRKVAAPIVLGLLWSGGAIAAACVVLPSLFRAR